jgi:hydroxypyruvate reductase
MNPDEPMNRLAARPFLAALYRAALAGTDPRTGVQKALASPRIRRMLAGARGVGVFAAGKAAAGMLAGTAGRFDRGLAILPKGFPAVRARGVRVLRASHPEPDRASERAARAALKFFRSFEADDVILCLISGGSSSLLALPRAGCTLEAKRRAVRKLTAAGASIDEINRLRTRLSAVKGGRLGRATKARLIHLVLSDVPGDRPEVVGSGPTIRGRKGDPVRVVGTNRMGLEAAAAFARKEGLRPRIGTRRLEGEARLAGDAFGRLAARLKRGEVLLAGGETTVALGRAPGRGGRNLEVALAASRAIRGRAEIALLAAGSDGRDGASDAAGAFGGGDTFGRALRLGLDPDAAAARHDTHPFFARLDDLFRTGPTGDNVADWAFALRL